LSLLIRKKFCYTKIMVEGTRQFRKKTSSPAPSTDPDNSPQVESSPVDPRSSRLSEEPEKTDAVNLGRRAWLGALVPTLGGGLVKILRSSNNLQRDLHEAFKGKADDLFSPPQEDPNEKS